jgi:hypothetical protein
MELARSLHMTLADLFSRADSRELGLWMALSRIENDERRLQALVERAENARIKRKK